MRCRTSFVGLVAVVGLATCGCSSSAGDGPGAATRDAGVTTPLPATSTASVLPRYVDRSVAVATAPSELGVGFGSVWVVSHRGGEVDRINPRLRRVIARISSPGTELVGIAIGAGHVWYLDADRRQVEGINAHTNRIDVKVPVGSDGGSVAFGAGALWFAGTSGKLVRINPSNGRVNGALHLGGKFLTVHGNGQSLWVADGDRSRLYSVDPHTMRVSHTAQLKGSLVALASGAGSLWVGADDGYLYRLDPRTDTVRQTITLPAVDHLAYGAQRMWVRVSDVSLVGVDNSGKVVARYTLPSAEIPGGGIAYLGSAVWAANWTQDDVWRIPTRT